ncbi:MAG: site-2 protease family protein [Candidatus Kerfeldbacteria bacterium]|nr:site-2 protease family protein [Candidatus Kerfeldbacteria bacterium]
MPIILFIVILSVLIFVHEFGHFYVARRFGIAVEEFGFGFPPRLWGRRRGQTIYSLNWIPFGGFVRLQGEQEDGDRRPDSFVNAKPSRQYAVIAAGVVMNALLAWVLITAVLAMGVPTDTASVPTDRFVQLSDVKTQTIVSDGSPTARAGITTGDVIVAIDGMAMKTTSDLIAYAQAKGYPTLNISYTHEGQTATATVAPEPSQDHPRYGFGLETLGTMSYPWYVAPWYGLTNSGRLLVQTIQGLWQVAVSFFQTGQVSSDVTGPVGIAVLTGQVSRLGAIALLQFMAILSVSLAVVNFLPLPALDGGRALFILIARLRGRPINRRIENLFHLAGFYALLLLVVLISIRDVRRFGIIERVMDIWK